MIHLDRIIPTYFNEQQTKHSQIWNQPIQINHSKLIEVIAPSGSGKTSLIHFLYGMRNNYQGEIFIDQQSITKADKNVIAAIRREKLSIVFQDLRLFPQLTVEENLQLQQNVSPFLTIEEVKSMMDRLGVLHKWNQLASLCSYGEQQRVAIVRALSKPFEYLLLDEPFSHLDEQNTLLALDLIQKQVKKRNATMILADLNKNHSYQPDQIFHL